MGLLLHLTDRSGASILLTVVERIIFLRDFQTEDGIANESADKDEGTNERGNLRPLQLEMHSTTRIWKFEIKIFIGVTSGMGKVVSEVISVHIVVMDEATTVLSLRLEVKSYIVPMSWPNLIIGMLGMSEILGERKWHTSSFQKSHFTLKVLIIAGVILFSKKIN